MTAAQNNVDHGIAIQTGKGSATITDNFNTDTVTVTATAAGTIIDVGSANFVVHSAVGANTMTGGTGHNSYAYDATADSTPSAHDTITNFHVATDTIDFSAISGLNSSNQAVTINFLTATPTSIAPHTIDVVTIGANTTVYADASGKSESISANHQDMQINLSGVTAMSTSDFILHM